MSIYTCYNRTLKDYYLAPAGYEVTTSLHPRTGTYQVVQLYRRIPDRMSRACQYTRSKKTNGDPHCVGCKHKSDNPDLNY